MKLFRNFYHYLVAWLGSLIYGRPSKNIFVLGVTGTKGKSTVLELINAILEAVGEKTALLSSVRVKIGPESRKNITDNTMPGRSFIQRFLREAVQAGCNYALIEVTSEGVLQHRHRFIDFDAALFTNLHPEHIERHGSFENYRAAKVKFFSDIAGTSKKSAKMFFINQEDLNSGYFADAVSGRGEIYYFSRGNFIETKLARGRVSLGNWLANDFNLENAAAAARFAESLGIDWPTARSALKSFPGVPGRMEAVQERPFRIVIDYAHTPDSLELVYKILSGTRHQVPRTRNQKLICVFGSDGGGRDKWKRPVLGEIAARFCRKIILTVENPYDENPSQILSEIKSGISNVKIPMSNVYEIIDRREAIKKAVSLAKKGDTVIITGKGSEQWIHIANGEKIPWDEAKIVKELLSK